LSYLLDSDTCIRYLNGRSPAIKSRLERTDQDLVRVCSVVRAELLCGAYKSQNRERTIEKLTRFLAAFESLPFDDSAADSYGRIRGELETKGTPIGGNDLMIAAIALVYNATLVTNNIREFSRVSGLVCETWDTLPS
jgi:tRNA(fMet)-specific endonuclease VapC